MAGSNQTRYNDEFREQIVRLTKNGKSVAEINREYGLSKTSIRNWVAKYDNSKSFRDKDNYSGEKKELIELRKENKQLRMEVDLLKQAALIMARR
jgi:transposase